ncbi:MAG TPA: UrcA family protein [Allosphingosinicella sp.]|nr:UrcA family protein [Allosphingosinicella sp.]
MSLRTIALAAAAITAATFTTTVATPASAAEIVVAPETVTVRVSYADLNLASADGRAQLDRRIAGAARGICGAFFPIDLRMSALVSDCRADAIASARIPAAVASSDGARSVAVTGYRLSRAAN